MSVNVSSQRALYYKALTVRPFTVKAIAALSFLLLPSLPANAQNLIANGSFETGNFTGVNPGGDADITRSLIGATNLTGWTVFAGDIAWEGNATEFGALASDGTRSLDLSGYSDDLPHGAVQRSVSLVPGARTGSPLMWAGSPSFRQRLSALRRRRAVPATRSAISR